MSKFDILTPVTGGDETDVKAMSQRNPAHFDMGAAMLRLTDLMLSIQDSQTDMVEHYVGNDREPRTGYRKAELSAQAMQNELLEAAALLEQQIRPALVALLGSHHGRAAR